MLLLSMMMMMMMMSNLTCERIEGSVQLSGVRETLILTPGFHPFLLFFTEPPRWRCRVRANALHSRLYSRWHVSLCALLKKKKYIYINKGGKLSAQSSLRSLLSPKLERVSFLRLSSTVRMDSVEVLDSSVTFLVVGAQELEPCWVRPAGAPHICWERGREGGAQRHREAERSPLLWETLEGEGYMFFCH